MISIGARIFVGLVFTVLGVSFVITTAVMIDEFLETEWFSIATFYSHLFVFFPTFGLVTLAAFYVPACVFTDMYWRHVHYGRFRFLIGFGVLIVASFAISQALLQGEERAFFEIKPQTLRSDTGSPSGCNNDDATRCSRLPALQALSEVREISQSRIGLSQFGRNCRPDPLVELGSEYKERRWCFVTRSMENAASCCRAQKRFGAFMTASYAGGENQSFTAVVANALLPFKVFFLLVLLAVGILLAIRRAGVDRFYSSMSKRIETGVLTGAGVMLLWPVMNHAFLQSAAVLYGNNGDSLFRYLGPGFSVIFGAWGLLLLLFFYRRHGHSIEAVGKIAGLMASAIAVLQYDHIVDYSVRIAGAGASHLTMGVLLALGLLALVQLGVRMWSRDGSGLGEDPLDTGAVANAGKEPEVLSARGPDEQAPATPGVMSPGQISP